jgi:hypothetical protein
MGPSLRLGGEPTRYPAPAAASRGAGGARAGFCLMAGCSTLINFVSFLAGPIL